MPDLSLSDFAAQVKDNVFDNLGATANVAADLVCDLYFSSPAAFITNAAKQTGAPLPYGGLLEGQRALYDTLCAPKNKVPPLPPVPPVGGQCAGVQYRISYSWTENSIVFGQVETRTQSDVQDVIGPIQGAYLKAPITENQQGKTITGFDQYVVRCNGLAFQAAVPNSEVILRRFDQTGGTSAVVAVSASINSIQRLGGAADNCGDMRPSYPDKPVTPDQLSRNTTIQVSPTVSIPVSVKIVPVFAPITNIFRPEINVDVGGINVNFSLGGITFSPSLQIPVGVNFPIAPLPPGSPSPRPIPPSGGGTSTPTDLTPVTDKLDDLLARREPCPCPDPADPTDPEYINKTVSSGSLRSGSIPIPPGTYKVRVLLSEQPSNVKTESGDTQANVIYAGWGRFRSGGSLADREPIDAADVQFIPPNDSQDAFTWVCRLGHKAVCTVYYKEKQP